MSYDSDIIADTIKGRKELDASLYVDFKNAVVAYETLQMAILTKGVKARAWESAGKEWEWKSEAKKAGKTKAEACKQEETEYLEAEEAEKSAREFWLVAKKKIW
jgi:hypothetical protein